MYTGCLKDKNVLKIKKREVDPNSSKFKITKLINWYY